MAKQPMQPQLLPSTRVNSLLKERFLQAAEMNAQTPSEAMRTAVTAYVQRTDALELRRQSAEIRAAVDDEIDVLNWIAAASLASQGDD